MDSPKHDDALSAKLQEWHVQPAADPDFRPAVWRRITQRSAESWANYVRAHRLRWAVVTGALLVVGSWRGHAAAEARIAAEREAMVVTYLTGLDPRVQAKLRP